MDPVQCRCTLHTHNLFLNLFKSLRRNRLLSGNGIVVNPCPNMILRVFLKSTKTSLAHISIPYQTQSQTYIQQNLMRKGSFFHSTNKLCISLE